MIFDKSMMERLNIWFSDFTENPENNKGVPKLFITNSPSPAPLFRPTFTRVNRSTSRRVRPAPTVTIRSTTNTDDKKILFVISIDNKEYWIKITKFVTEHWHHPDNINKQFLNGQPLDQQILGTYTYEARMYQEINNQLKNTPYENQITKIFDWGVHKFTNVTDKFDISIGSDNINLNLYNNNELGTKLISNGKRLTYPSGSSNDYGSQYYSYMITEHDRNVAPLHDSIYECKSNYHSLTIEERRVQTNNIKELLKRTILLLQNLFKMNNFVHWDFHSGNILYNKNTNSVKLFDFDTTEINYTNSSGIISRSQGWIPRLFSRSGYIFNRLNIQFNRTDIIQYMGHYYDYFRLLNENKWDTLGINIKHLKNDLNLGNCIYHNPPDYPSKNDLKNLLLNDPFSEMIREGSLFYKKCA